MALFSKEACCFCGKEVGMMSRSKLSSGEYICTDCKYLTHPFLRIDHMSKDQAQAVMEEMEQNEARFQATQWRQTKRAHNGKTWIFYDNYDEGVFSLYTPETKNYKNHFVFDMLLVRPYDKRLEGSRMPALAKTQVAQSITLQQKKDASGQPGDWEMYIPYFRNDMNITIRFPAAMPENDLRYVWSTAQQIIANYVAGQAEKARDAHILHQQNSTKTAGEAVKAVVQGKGAEGVTQAVKKGIEKSQAINEGKVKKKGFFASLFGKK